MWDNNSTAQVCKWHNAVTLCCWWQDSDWLNKRDRAVTKLTQYFAQQREKELIAGRAEGDGGWIMWRWSESDTEGSGVRKRWELFYHSVSQHTAPLKWSNTTETYREFKIHKQWGRLQENMSHGASDSLISIYPFMSDPVWPKSCFLNYCAISQHFTFIYVAFLKEMSLVWENQTWNCSRSYLSFWCLN